MLDKKKKTLLFTSLERMLKALSDQHSVRTSYRLCK